MSDKENTESRIKQDNRTIYDYLKLVFGCFIIGLVIVALSFVALVYRVPADKLIIDFSLGDGVISIIATLIGVMVTFVIGYQILNALDVNKKIAEIDIKVDNKGNALNNEIQNSIRYMDCKIKFDSYLTHITLLKKLFGNNNNDLKYLIEAYELVENYLSILYHARNIEYLDISNNVYANLHCCKASISFAIQLIISDAINDNSRCSERYQNILNLTNEIKDSESLTPFNEYLNIIYDCLKDKTYDAHKMQTTYF